MQILQHHIQKRFCVKFLVWWPSPTDCLLLYGRLFVCVGGVRMYNPCRKTPSVPQSLRYPPTTTTPISKPLLTHTPPSFIPSVWHWHSGKTRHFLISPALPPLWFFPWIVLKLPFLHNFAFKCVTSILIRFSVMILVKDNFLEYWRNMPQTTGLNRRSETLASRL